MLVRNLFLILLPVFIFRNLFLNENRSSLFLRVASSQHSSYIRAIPVMSLLRILLEGDHGFSIRYSPVRRLVKAIQKPSSYGVPL
jgi:hypothetical protein